MLMKGILIKSEISLGGKHVILGFLRHHSSLLVVANSLLEEIGLSLH